jgi:hypothetical protein
MLRRVALVRTDVSEEEEKRRRSGGMEGEDEEKGER